MQLHEALTVQQHGAPKMQQQPQTVQQQYTTTVEQLSPAQQHETAMQQQEPPTRQHKKTSTGQQHPPKMQQVPPTVQQQEILTVQQQEAPSVKQKAAVTMQLQEALTVQQRPPTVQQEETTPIQQDEPPTVQQESPTVNQGPPTIQQKETQTMQQETPSVQQQEPPTVQQEEPTLQQESPTVKQEPPTMQQKETQTMQQETQTVQQETQTVQQKTPSVQQGPPTVQQEEPPTLQQESPTVKQEPPTMQQKETQTVQQKTPSVQQEPPTVHQQQSPIVQQQEPIHITQIISPQFIMPSQVHYPSSSSTIPPCPYALQQFINYPPSSSCPPQFIYYPPFQNIQQGSPTVQRQQPQPSVQQQSPTTHQEPSTVQQQSLTAQQPPTIQQQPPTVQQQQPLTLSQQQTETMQQELPTEQHQALSTMIQPEPPNVKQQEPPTVKQQEPPTVKQQEPPNVKQQEPPTVKQQDPPTVKQQEPPRKRKAHQSLQQDATKASATHTSNKQESTKKERDAASNPMDESHDKVIIKFKWEKVKATTTISGRKSESLIDVLQKSLYFRRKYKESFTLLIHATKDTHALVNPCVPLGALPEGEEFEISQRAAKPQHDSQTYTKGSRGIQIRVARKGKTLGGTVRVIIHYIDLCPGEKTLEVFGYRHQTIKEAIVNDGRFKFGPECEFSLKGGKEEEHIGSYRRLSILRKQYTDTKYTIVFPNGDNNVISKSGSVENSNVSTQIPHYKARKSMCNEPLYEEFVKKFKKSYWTKGSWEILKENFSSDIKCMAVTQDSTQRLLTQHLNSVGLVMFRGSREHVVGSCFVLAGNLVVTCGQVMKEVHELEQSMENIIIIFNYEREEDKPKAPFYTVVHVVTWNSEMDFAILRLNPDTALPRGLLEYLDFPPISGPVSVIGHAQNRAKQVDVFSMIRYDHRVSAVSKRSPIHMATSDTFQMMNNQGLETCSSCFYNGASGSPVFNASGKLVAMHAGEYVVNDSESRHHVVQFARSIAQILIHWAHELNDPNLLRFTEKIEEPNGLRLIIKRVLQL
uniref:Uncharacterized protein n=1 Tax=Leptobrachium leishanense TaxID=445787 RepID=A0A8C5MD02_9ANUR